MSNEAVKALLSNNAPPAAMTDGGILADLFRRMLTSLNVDEFKWDELMDKFVRQELQLIENPEAGTYDALGANLTKELTAPTMTWKTYLNSLRFLGLTGAQFTVSGTVNGIGMIPISNQVNWTGPQKPSAPDTTSQPTT